MSEDQVILSTSSCATHATLCDDLQELGVRPGMTLLVHSSLSALGWVCGGAQAVIMSLLDVVGDEGTLVMPAHTSDLSDPAFWHNPPVPTNWWPTIRDQMPAYDPAMTPTRAMGKIPELFRTLPGVSRSAHPQYSFAALGPHADRITGDHQFNFGLGDGSPLARLYDLHGFVLLLGVTHDRNTSLHLAEHRTEPIRNKRVRNGAPVLRDGKRLWLEIEDYELSSHDFNEIGQRFSRRSDVSWNTGRVGQGRAELLSQREVVDFAVSWMEKNR